jgi:hypothetical protein
MNPWGLFLIIIGFLLIVMGVKGTQGNVLAAFKGVKQGQSTPIIKKGLGQ